jgi:hypothetical protein
MSFIKLNIKTRVRFAAGRQEVFFMLFFLICIIIKYMFFLQINSIFQILTYKMRLFKLIQIY